MPIGKGWLDDTQDISEDAGEFSFAHLGFDPAGRFDDPPA